MSGKRGAARWVLLAAASVALASAGCPARESAGQAGLGRRLVAGPVKSLLASADGAWLAMLDGCVEVKGRFLPPGTGLCDLKVLSTGGGEPLLLARAVPTLPHGAVFAPEGNGLAVLAQYDFGTGAGTLLLVRDGAARELARDVTFHGFVPGGGASLAAVAGGRLLVFDPGGEPAGQLGAGAIGAGPIATFELRRRADGVVVGLARTHGARRGTLLGLELGRLEPAGRPIAEGTVDYAVAPGGRAFAYSATGRRGAELFLGTAFDRKAARVAEGARTFGFAPDGSALAWISDATPGKQGDLLLAAPGGAPRRLGREVGEHRWAAAAPRLAWLEQYDPRGRSGVLAVGGPGVEPRSFGKNVTDFELSADGARLAFLRHTVEGGYSVDLWAGDVSGQPRKLAGGVFGFAFSPDGRWLYYRTRCTRNGDACDLERVAMDGAGEAPAELARGVKSFEFDPRDSRRLLLTWQRSDLVALDFGLWRDGKSTPIDRAALPGSIHFLGPDSRRLGFAVVQPQRAGVYVAGPPPE